MDTGLDSDGDDSPAKLGGLSGRPFAWNASQNGGPTCLQLSGEIAAIDFHLNRPPAW
jgi:hypothetical protein